MTSLRSHVTNFFSVRQAFQEAKQQWVLGLMLLSLHGVVLWGFSSPLSKALVLTHYGLFLLWQPIWRTKIKLSFAAVTLFLAGGVLMIFFINWWVIAFWMAGLFGLLGGRVFSTRTKMLRISYLLAVGYLLTALLLWVVPKLLNATQDVAAAYYAVEYLLPVLPLSILFLRVETEDSQYQPVLDFFYTLLLLLLAAILVLGSFAIGASSETNYIEILLKMLFSLAAILLLISWLWNPRAGFVGIGHLLSRYLLSVGLPFEQWIKNIAELAEHQSTPQNFIYSAMKEVVALPWVSGLSWHSHDGSDKLGAVTKHQEAFQFHELHLTIYTRWPLTPALLLHVKLLTQLLGEFYEAKRREEVLQQNTYMHAVYETGARLTHDIKNLVQSLSALCTAAEQTSEEDSDRLVALIRRQLPLLNHRLALTLDKLQAPKNQTARNQPLTEWWNDLKQRHANGGVLFTGNDIPAVEVDAEILDSIVDNLLQNALEKAKNEPGIHIEAILADENGLYIEVVDSGRAMPQFVADQLFKKQITSENGLGIGLYHAGKQAQQGGYLLSLTENRDSAVRFRISRQASTS
jgi:signal transduction histidine kinase